MTDATKQEPTPSLGNLAAIAKVTNDPTGLETFARYVWQAKQVVRQWLTCLREQDGPAFAVCEQIEDLALVHSDKVRLIQLKTRDKGSWSVVAMCESGLDALVRSYVNARKAKCHELYSYELWLEGTTAPKADTASFVRDPTTASNDVRARLVAHGLIRAWVDDFLQRLVIEPGQPTQMYIDKVAMWEMSALWPALSHQEVQHLYERLLSAASAAQTGGAGQPASIQAILAAALPHVSHDLPRPGEPGWSDIEPIHNQTLSRSMLTSLTPPLPGERQHRLLARMANGSATSLMELKMRAAGASTTLIEDVQELRATMEVERQLLLASRDNAESELEDLARRVLRMAQATSTRIKLSAVGNPVAAGRPAEAIAADLRARPHDLAQCDRKPLLHQDEELIFGYLGHLSDLCRFDWGLS
ncbi:dsDNA nuclease domain-containing protein [Micromonospora chalcea]|uniref:dsDNA nuclease domain-containing protein n=1 Tax=Micromonospora chalcea TaxID=1874 RepID=UPI002379320B|nr:dsDNA nuclease domain-containing protein [Micromonospora chalcea]WDP98632.1 dsDNA nuclease domain-containing protein [Micromonospora chalcea]